MIWQPIPRGQRRHRISFILIGSQLGGPHHQVLGLVDHEIHPHFSILQSILPAQDQDHSRHEEPEAEVCVCRHDFQSHDVIEQGGDEGYELFRDLEDERRVYLIESDIGEHDVEAEHDAHVEDGYEISSVEQSENSIKLIEGKFAASEVVAKTDVVEANKEILEEKVQKTRFFRKLQLVFLVEQSTAD